MENDIPTFRIALVGSSSVGKTCIATRFTRNTFTEMELTTVGVDYQTRKAFVGRQLIKFEIWDTTGQERFKAVTPVYLRKADAVIIVYSITDRKSFTDLEEWHAFVTNHAPESAFVAVVEAKADLEGSREVEIEDGKGFAENQKALFFETSSKTDYNIAELFQALGKEFIARRIPPQNNQGIIMPGQGRGEEQPKPGQCSC